MPTGLKLNLKTVKIGGLNLQAIPTQKSVSIPKLQPLAGGVGTPNNGPAYNGLALQSIPQKFSTPFMPPLTTIVPKPDPGGFSKNIKLFDKPLNNFDPVELAGITKERPEIMMLMDFLPIYRGNSTRLSSAGKFMDIQLAARNLKIEKASRLRKQLDDNEETAPVIKLIEDRWKGKVREAAKDVDFLEAMMSAILSAKNSLNVRKHASKLFFLLGKRSYRELFTNELQFSEDGYNSFSNSKIFAQLLFDLKTAATLYSPLLFDARDDDRSTDKDPVILDKTVNLNDGKFAFDMSEFESTSAKSINMAKIQEHSKLISSLPSDLTDRTKLLCQVLSKELRVSRGLGNKTTSKIIESTFGGSDQGDPFANIIGEPGESVTDIPQGDQSLSNLIRFVGEDNTIVLPFENVYITDENDRTYVPGSVYMIDSILQKTPQFDLSKLIGFKESLETRLTDGISAMNGLLGLNNANDELSAINIFLQMIDSVSNLLKATESSDFGNTRTLGLFKIANIDMELKSMLFQYLLLTMFTDTKLIIGGKLTRDLFDEIQDLEIRKFSDFSRVVLIDPLDEDSLTSDSSLLTAARNQLAERIVNRLFDVVASTQPENPGGVIKMTTKEEIMDSLLEPQSIVAFRIIGRHASRLFSIAGKKAFLEDSGHSRYNRLSLSTIAAMVFEMFSSMYVTYGASNYFGVVKDNTTTRIRSIADLDKARLHRRVFDVAENEISKTANRKSAFIASQLAGQGEGGQNQAVAALALLGGFVAIAIFGSLNEMGKKLKAEDDLLRDIISLLRATLKKVKSSLGKLSSFFDPNGANANMLQAFQSGEDAAERSAMLNEGQVNLAQAELWNLKYNSIQSTGPSPDPINPLQPIKHEGKKTRRSKKPFFDNSDISTRERRDLFRLLTKQQFRDRYASDVKVLTVGIPSGFMSSLRTRVDADDVDPSALNGAEQDVISINVYKKDMELEDIVFKPQRHVFEMSRFITTRRFDYGGNFLAQPWLVQRNFSSVTGEFAREGDIRENENYSFLAPDESFELMENHLYSHLLGIYIKLMTGVSTTESDYLASEGITNDPFDDETRTIFRNLLNKHISAIAGQELTIDDVAEQSPQLAAVLEKINNFSLTKSAVEQINNVAIESIDQAASIEVTEDIIDMMDMFSPNSFLAGASAATRKVLSPKLFERIFNIAIDPDDFEVDVEATQETFYGKRALTRLDASKRLRRLKVAGELVIKVAPRTRRENAVVYDEFFVTVSSVGGHVI